jgi:P63C domain-containing protein
MYYNFIHAAASKKYVAEDLSMKKDALDVTKAAKVMSKLGASKGGIARANVLTSEEKKEIARKAVNTRWAKVRTVKDRTRPTEQVEPLRKAENTPQDDRPDSLPIGHEDRIRVSLFKGDVQFGDMIVQCHVLDDESRVIAQREVVKALTQQERPSGSITRLIGVPPLTDYINTDDIAKKILQYKLSGPGHQMTAYGYEATLLIEVCEAFLRARDDGALSEGQLRIARRAEIILRACAKVGIIALIDEATGYQEVRKKNALHLKLQAFIADDMQEWARLFPEEFWFELARIEHTRYIPGSRPIRWGKYVMAFIYDAVDADVGQELWRINPNPHYKMNHHQWLKKFGRDKIRDHLNQVLGVMKTCQDMDSFKRQFAHVFNDAPLQMNFFDIVE